MTTHESGDQSEHDSVDVEQTVLVPRAPSTGEPEPAQTPAPDLEATVVRLVEPAAPRRESVADMLRASRGGSPQSDEAATAARWALRVRGTTAVVPLDVPVVVGRRPAAQRVAEHPPPRRIVIPADRADVSGRHARVEQLGDSLVVSDLGSTNGIVVHWSSGSRSRLRPGESCALLPDAVIVLGKGVELEFLAADAV